MFNFINTLSIFLFLSISTSCLAQSSDSCSIVPTAVATIDGITLKGMLRMEDLPKIKKLLPGEDGQKILSFTYSIDCDNCEIITHRVFSNSFSEEDLRLLTAIKSKQILSFECIVGTNKKGELIAFKPFLFYIR